MWLMTLCYDVIAVLNEPDEEPTAEILKSDLTWAEF